MVQGPVSSLLAGLFVFMLTLLGLFLLSLGPLQGDQDPPVTAKPKTKKCSICAKQIPFPTPSQHVSYAWLKSLSTKPSFFLDYIKSLIREKIHSPLSNLSQPEAPSASGTPAKKDPIYLSDSIEGFSNLEEGGERGYDSSDENDNYKKNTCVILMIFKAIRAIVRIEDPKRPWSIQDEICESIGERRRRVFPVNDNIFTGLLKRNGRNHRRLCLFLNALREGTH